MTIELSEYVINAIADAVVKKMQQPCKDAISRQAVKDMLDARGVKAVMTFEHFKELLDKLPSVNPQPKTDTWSIKEVAGALEKHGLIREQKPCEDAISREAAIEVVKKWFDKIQLNGDICLDGIISLPPVTPQPKTGHWIYGIDEDTGEKDLYAWTCSECEGKYPWQPKYCPNCGAKMERKDEDADSD